MPGLSRGTRASKGFTVLTVGLASFTDALLYGIGIPVLPFVLPKLFGLPEDDVQRWNAILTEVFGGTIAVGAGKRETTIALKAALKPFHDATENH